MQPTASSVSVAEADAIRRLLDRGGLIDITTTGRRTGAPRRIEIVFHNIDGRIVISGRPSRRTRGWIHNLEADPRLVVHLKGTLSADIPATARIITDPSERREIAGWIGENAWRGMDVESMAAYSPMVEVTLEGFPA